MTAEEALEQKLLYIAYQPIIDLQRQRLFGYEALVRSETPLLPTPLEIIASAVQHRFMGQLGRALRQLAVDNCPEVALFLNIHPDEFDDRWLVRPDDAVAQHTCDVFIEVTETVPISHYRFCHSVLREIRNKGTKLAVDDLGAGYSNLKYIADLAPEIVKLDRGLIAGLDERPRLQLLVNSIVRLCDDLGAKVVAEGIETIGELRAAVDAGCHFGQGFYLARPHRTPPEADWAALIDGNELAPV